MTSANTGRNSASRTCHEIRVFGDVLPAFCALGHTTFAICDRQTPVRNLNLSLRHSPTCPDYSLIRRLIPHSTSDQDVDPEESAAADEEGPGGWRALLAVTVLGCRILSVRPRKGCGLFLLFFSASSRSQSAGCHDRHHFLGSPHLRPLHPGWV